MAALMKKVPTKLVKIRICCGPRKADAFWINFQKDGDVSVGSSDRRLRVQRIGPDGIRISDQFVDRPHVSYHPRTNLTHLTGNKQGAPIWDALTWGAPEPGREPCSWLAFVTSPICKLRPAQARTGQPVEHW